MGEFLKYLEGCEQGCQLDAASVLLDDSSADRLHFAVNPSKLDVRVTAQNRAARLVILRSAENVSGEVNIALGDGAKLNIVELMCDFSSSSVNISQSSNSVLNSTLLQLSDSKSDCNINLDSEGAEAEVYMLQLATGSDLVRCNLKISHLAPHCTSRSIAKCVANGESTGEFHGLVYVAPGAQQTLSEQSSRNIALSREAKIIAEPQLEIYADDVKCTHGATVGQMDKDAVLYMRQRGLSEEQARKVQLDGFVADVVYGCAIEELREPLIEAVRERLYEL